MGGSTERGNTRPYAEFNALVDPEAAEIVFSSGKPLTMVGLNLTHQAQATPEVVERLRAVGNPAAEAAIGWLSFFADTYRTVYGMAGPPVHDACAVALIIDPSLVRSVETFVGHRDRGALDAGRHGGRPPRAPRATPEREGGHGARCDGFWDLVIGAIARAVIAVVGSINLDLVVTVERHPAPGETVHRRRPPRAARRQGRQPGRRGGAPGRHVAMVGRVGADAQGARLRKHLADEGIDVEHVIVDEDAPTGMALIAVDGAGENTIVVSPGANAHVGAGDVEAAGEVLAAAAVTLLQHEVPGSAVSAAIAAAGGKVVLNPAPARALVARGGRARPQPR